MPTVTGRDVAISKIANLLSPSELTGPADVIVNRVVADSRDAAKGSVFVAVPGTKTDGAEFALDAVMRGAEAVVSEKFLEVVPMKVPQVVVSDARLALSALAAHLAGYPTLDLAVIGVTGTNGKTTTTHFLRSIFDAAGAKSGLIGTNGFDICGYETRASHTTPDPLTLQGLFREVKERGGDVCAVEVSSHALAQQRVADVDFDVAVFTNLTPEHMEYHATIEDYRKAKCSMFSGMRADAPSVINFDDPSADYFIEASAGPVFSYGVNSKADYRATGIAPGLNGTAFTLVFPDRRETLRLNLSGKYNVYNAVAAAAAAHLAGFDPDMIVAGLENLRAVKGRLEAIEGDGITVFIDYAHSSDALENVLKNLRGLVPGRIITVFGCGGDRGKKKRPMMGASAAKYSDHCIITSDNPRSEDPYAIIEDIIPGFGRKKNYEAVSDRGRAIRTAVKMAESGDAILVAGKGHEDYQIFADRTVHFDDAEEVRRALIERVAERN